MAFWVLAPVTAVAVAALALVQRRQADTPDERSTARSELDSAQGLRGMSQLFIAALVFGVLYLVSGSLWLPIAAHVAIDLNGGRFALLVYGDGVPETGSGGRPPTSSS